MKKVSLYKVNNCDSIFGWDHKEKMEFAYDTIDNQIRKGDYRMSKDDFLRGICVPYQFLGEFTVEELNPEKIGKLV